MTPLNSSHEFNLQAQANEYYATIKITRFIKAVTKPKLRDLKANFDETLG